VPGHQLSLTPAGIWHFYTLTEDRNPGRNDTRQDRQIETPSALNNFFHAGSKLDGIEAFHSLLDFT
jgi:hypothetical protein